MPRLPKKSSPLRRFREATGHSQKSFGHLLNDLCGIAPSTYKSYELQVRELPFEVAIQLMIRFGVEPKSLLKKSGEPKDLASRPYSEKSFASWPKERLFDAGATTIVIERALDGLIRMLLAARRAGKFSLALSLMMKFTSDLQQKLVLESHYSTLAEGERPFEPWDPIKTYLGGGLIPQPERNKFPLAEVTYERIKELDQQMSICTGLGRLDEFNRKEREFFSEKESGKRPITRTRRVAG